MIRIDNNGGGRYFLYYHVTVELPPLTITSITPNTVQAGLSPGSVTINGTNFSASNNTVTFTDPGTDTASASIVPNAQSANSITVTGPTYQSAGVSTVTVRTADGRTVTGSFTYRPGVTGVAGNGGPNGPPAGGNSVVLSGTGFIGATAVNFGANPATTFRIDSQAQITATAPAGSGSVNITVTSRGVTSTNTATYNYVLPVPTVASISPTGGSTGGGTVVRITGTNFVDGDTYTATFGTATAVPATFATTNTLTTTAPAGTGTVAVTVTNTTTSQAATGSADYTYAAPTVGALSRRVGAAGQAQADVTITGTNFTPAATVAVGGTAATNVRVNSATQIVADLPVKPAGQYDVQVTTGTVTTTPTTASRFTYYPAPTITGFSPTSGRLAGGTRVVVSGTNLLPASGTPNITFGGQAATVNVNDPQSASSVIVYTPSRGTAGSVQVQAITEGGTATAGGSFTYAGTPAAPVVTAPANGVTINVRRPVVTGTAQANSVVTIYIDNQARGTDTASAGGAFSITPTADLGDGTHSVRADARPAADSDAVSASSNTNTFTVDLTPPAAPVITAPADGATVTTQTPTLTGTAEANSTVTVSFDTGTGGGSTTVDATGNWSFTATAPLGLGARTASATARDAATNVSSAATRSFNIFQAPAITSVSPVQGSTAGSQTITITGSGFTGVDPATGVTVGGTAATNVTVTANQITATTPAGTAGTTTVQVMNAAGSASTAYTYLAPPTATAQAVTVAYQTATPITLTGTNATGYAYTQPANGGTVSGTGPNVTFTPAAGYSGTTSFTFTTTNGSGAGAPQSAPATVTVTVNPARPTVIGQPADRTVAVGATASFTATASGSPTVQWESSNDRGASYTAIAGATTTTYSFTASAADNGNRYRAVFTNAGGSTASNAAALTVVQAPTANNQSVAVPFNTATAITLTGTDPQGRTLTYTVATGPAHATLAGTAPNLTYTPTAGYVGTDSFTFTVNNGTVTSSAATVSITVGKGNQTIAFSPANGPTDAMVGGATYTVAASATSGLAVSFASTTTGVCTLSGTTVSFVGAGTCTIAADQAGNATYNPAPQAQQSFAVAAPTIVVQPQPNIPDPQVGTAYSQAFSTANGVGPYSYAVTAGALPPGLTLANGTLSGTPTRSGTATFTITSTDSSTGSGAPFSGSRSYTVTVAAPTVAITPTSLPPASGGQAYAQALTASGGTAPYTFTTAGPLPAGLSLSSGGELSGTPTQSGSFTFDVVATDSSTGSAQPGGRYGATQRYTLAVAAPTITIAPATLPNGTVAASYSQALTATGGTGGYTFSIVAGSGALPAGVTLANGTLSGTPTAGGTFTFTVRATDGSGFSATRAYTLVIGAPTVTIAPGSLPGATRGAAYSQQLAASGGTSGYAFSATGTLPSGVTLSSTGLLAGTPTVAGSYTFTVAARDSSTGDGPYAGTTSYTLAVAAPTITLTPSALPGGSTRIAYSQALTAAGGTGPYVYAVTAGALPAGYTLSTGGTLAGSTTAAGSYTFTATATDANGNTGSQGYTLAIDAPAIALAPTTLPAATTRTPYNQSLSATGGMAPYTYAVTAGATPAGITLSTTGTLSGTATAAGSFTFTIRATDASGNAGTQGYTLAVNAPAITLAPTTLPGATAGSAFSQAITASGGTGSYGYAVTAGALPAGLTLAADGTLAGTPTAGGSFTFTITATDGNGNSGARAYTVGVAAAQIALAPEALPAAATRIAYSQQLVATGGTAPYSYAVTAGALPAGLTLSASGTLSGTAAVAGSFTFTVTARDSSTGNGPFAGTRSYTLVVAAPAITLAPATLPDATTRVAYSQAITATGGAGSYGYAVTAGALPAGITLAAGGTLSGAATTAGSFTFTVTATDANGNAGARGYTLTVAAPAIALAPQTLAAARIGEAYAATLTATGGTAPYAFAVSAGALPAGVTLAEGGALAGTPTAGGDFTFTVRATDANGNAANRGYTLTVAAAQVVVAPATLPAGQVRVAYGQALTATGGTAPYSYAVTAGALPAGVTLAADGALSGTPTQGGSFSFTVSARDSSSGSGPYTGTRSYTLAIGAPALVLTPETLPATIRGAAYSQTLAATGGTAPYSFAATGTLPPGLTLSAGGVLSGRATTAGSYAFTVTATDATSAGDGGPYGVARSYTVAVTAPTIALAPATLPGGTFNAAYAADLSATGGTAPYAFAVTAGALPGGVTLSSAGRLAGTPTAAGQFGFTVTATDANGNAGAQAYTVAIAQGAQTISFANPGATSLSDTPVTLAATASSGLAVSFVSTTEGVCTVQGSTLTLARTGTCTVEARQAGNGDVAAATPVAQSFAVTPARLVATAAQASVSGQVGTALAPVTPVTVAGGTAPFAYALSGGTLPAGLALSESTGTLSGTPTGGQAATAYTVAVRDAGGQSATAGFSLAIAAPTLALGQATLPDGAFQAAYSQQLSVTGGTGPYRFAVTAGALPAGVTLSATGLVSGTPTAFGRFPVTITATDSSTGTGPYSVAQAYTLTIAPPAAPTASDASVTLAYGAGESVITPTLGGEVTSLAIVTQPSHGSVRVDGRTLVYAPATGYAGPDRFTYTASNAGGTSAPGTVSVTVSAPAVAITPASLPDARQDVAYGQQLSATGGAAPYAFSVASGTLPAGLTLSPAGALSGTPTASGTATFAVRATDSSTGAGPFGATQTYTLTVAVAAAPSVRPVPTVNAPGSSTAANTPTSIVLSDFVSGNVTSIQVVTPPQNGSVTLATAGAQTVATYIPRPNFAGTDSFGFVAVGPGGRSPVTSIALSVAGAAPVAAPLTATAVQGTPVTVNLTAAATGGPFTAAAVTGISPAGSVTAQVVEGGSAGARTYSLTLLPSLSFTGTATVTYTLSNQFGASAPGTVTLSVAGRPDPSGDATVNGLSAAQADATRRFARAQTDNFFRRNEQLHNGGSGTGGRDMGVGFSVAELGGLRSSGIGMAPDADDMATLKNDHAQAVLGAELASGALTIGRGGMNGLAGMRGRQVLQQGTGPVAAVGRYDALDQATGESRGGDAPANPEPGRRVGSVGIWSGGAVTVGAWDKDADRAKVTLTTSGLSAGADIKLSDTLIVGAGGGYGGDLSRIDGGKARIRGRSWSVAGYGSWAPTDGLFVDGIFGGGALDFDTRREVAQTGAIATGSRDGTMLFGSLAAGLDRRGTVDLSAYGRVDYLSARLDRYSETGGGIYGLTYGRRELESVASVLGLRVGYPMPGWTPRVRGEWRHEFADTDAQLIDYADVANLRYSTRGDFWIRDAFTIDVGAEFGLGRGWGLTTDIGATGGSGATAGTARIGIRKEF